MKTLAVLSIWLVFCLASGHAATPRGSRRADTATHPTEKASAGRKQPRKTTHPRRARSGQAQTPRARSAN